MARSSVGTILTGSRPLFKASSASLNSLSITRHNPVTNYQDPATSIFVQAEREFFWKFYTCHTLQALIGRYTC